MKRWRIASDSTDGYEHLERHETKGILGEPLDSAIGSIITQAYKYG